MEVAAPLSKPASLIFRPVAFDEELSLAGLFPGAQPLEVELGSGDGSFIAQYAKANPGKNFLGVERLLGRLRKIDRKGQRAGLTNLRLMRIEAAYFLEYLLPPQSIRAVHLYFPDPWPKRKHRKNRLVNERFPDLAKRVLVPGGEVFLRTDHVEYFSQMREVFGARQDFAEVETPTGLREIITDFERGFLAQGIRGNYAAYRLK